MANSEHLAILKKGVKAWNAWRKKNPDIRPNLREADLREADLGRVNFSGADLSEADLSGADLRRADLSRAELIDVNLRGADLRRADLSKAYLLAADLSEAHLIGANLSEALLAGADLSRADLRGADLSRANISDVNISGAQVADAAFTVAVLANTTFGDVDLSTVKGLETIMHLAPSSIGIDTIVRSRGKIPESFLRGCGVPDVWIVNIPDLIGAMEPIQYQSCFISYSSKDEEFAQRLYDKMRSKGLRVWFAPEEMRGGQKTIEQIDRAIQLNDRLLLLLSDQSMKSEWVKTEIRKARKVELVEGRRKLFPIRLVSFSRLEKWKCLATDPDEDLAAEVRSYHIPDFSNWKDHDAFEAAFADLLCDLKREAAKG